MNSHFSLNDIVVNALISDNPALMCIDQLEPRVQAQIAAAQEQGFHLVSVRWLTGQFALMFCEPGTQQPSIKNIINAYKQCLKTTQNFPEGTQYE